MQVTVENTSSLGRKLKVVVAAEDIDQRTDKKLNELKNKVKLAGFRPGKIPFAVMRRRFGDAARREIIADTIQETYFKALEQEKLRPAGEPHIEPKESNFGEPFEYTVAFEILPEIKLNDLIGVKIEKMVAEVTDTDVEEMIQKLLKQHATWEDIDRSCNSGNQVVIDFDGTIKSEPFSGGSAQNYKFELGSGVMLPDFEKNILGKKTGDSFKFKMKFPKDYHDKKVAGEKAEFEIKINKILVAKLPEINFEFLQKVGVKGDSEEGLRNEIRKNMERQLENVIVNKFKDTVLEQFISKNSIELPNVLVDAEIESLQKQAKQRFAHYAGKEIKDLPDLPKKEFEENARKRVTLGLLLGEFIKINDLKVEPQLVRARIETLTAGQEQAEEMVRWFYQDKERLRQIEAAILEEQAIRKLQEQIEVVEKKVTFAEIVNPKEEK